MNESTSEVHHTETNDIDETSLAEEQMKVTEIKIEDGIEGKATLGSLLPSIGNPKTRTEIVKEDAGFVDNSITTFFSPITNIDHDCGNREAIRTQTEEQNDLGCDGWLDKIQSYRAKKRKSSVHCVTSSL